VSSPSWDFPSPSANPSVEDDDIERDELEREQLEALERELLAQLEQEQNGAPAREQADGREREQQEREQTDGRERDQIEAREQEQLAQLAQMAQLDAADIDAAEIEASEQSEREELEELERESLRQLEEIERQQRAHVAAPPPAERPPPAPPAPVVPERPGADAQARAAAFLAAANERQAVEDAARGALISSAAATERREADERARAARAIVEHRHRNLVEANALLTEARRTLAPIAYRGLSDRIYRRRKVILAIGEAVSLAVAFSAAFDVAPIEALLLSGAIALAFVIAGDLGGVLRLTAERSRLSAAMEDDVVHLDPRYHHILYHDRQPWLSIIGGVTAAIFGVAAVSVGVLRASNQGSVGLAAGLGLLTVSLAIAAGLSSWQHASIGSEIIDHLQREEEAAARRLKRAAGARALRRPPVFSVVGSDESYQPSYADDLDWQAPPPPAPDGDWDTPTRELRPNRPSRAGRPAREKPAKARRERASGSLVGAAAARGAVFLATLPGKFRRSEDAGPGPKKESRKESKKESRIEDMSVSGDGPGALGESAGPISAVAFRPPIQSPKKFG
jgi:hypothetical protein